MRCENSDAILRCAHTLSVGHVQHAIAKIGVIETLEFHFASVLLETMASLSQL